MLFMGKLTISIAMFNSYVKLPGGNGWLHWDQEKEEEYGLAVEKNESMRIA